MKPAVASQVGVLLLQNEVALFFASQPLLQDQSDPVLLPRHCEVLYLELFEDLARPRCLLRALRLKDLTIMIGYGVVSAMMVILGQRLEGGVPSQEGVVAALALGFCSGCDSLGMGERKISFLCMAIANGAMALVGVPRGEVFEVVLQPEGSGPHRLFSNKFIATTKQPSLTPTNAASQSHNLQFSNIYLMLRGSSDFNQRQSLPKPQKHSLTKKKTLLTQPHLQPQPLPEQLLQQISFEANNRAQSFYRIAEACGVQSIVRLGWRIVELSLEEVDLALFCLSMLQAEVNFPFKIFSVDQDNHLKTGNQIYKDVWIQWIVAQHKNQDAQGFEVAVYRLVKDFLLPQLRHFIEKFMSWTYMSSPEYEDTKVINRFRREIIGPLQSKLKEFRPVPVVP